MTTILFFGPISDRFGGSLVVEVPAEGMTLGAISRQIAGGDGADLAVLSGKRIMVAVDNVVRGRPHEEILIQPGQEVAFMSPFSGG